MANKKEKETSINVSKKVDNDADDDNNEELCTCPLTLCKFTDPVILGDGVTYEKSAIEKWMSSKKAANAKYGPTGIPLKTKYYQSNYDILRWIKSSKQEKEGINCMISHEPAVSPVALLRLSTEANKKWTYDNYAYIYDCPFLHKNLQLTWGTYSRCFSLDSQANNDINILDLNESYVIVPNRLVRSINDKHKVEPSKIDFSKGVKLPMRKIMPNFNLALVNINNGFNLSDLDQKFHIINARMKPYVELNKNTNLGSIISNVYFVSSMFAAHYKSFTFVNCYFAHCKFLNICWCSILFKYCLFEDCQFSDCDDKGQSSPTINCDFKKCIVLNTTSREAYDMKQVLYGKQSIQNPNIDKNLVNIAALSVEHIFN